VPGKHIACCVCGFPSENKGQVLIYQFLSALDKEEVKEIPRQQRYSNRPPLRELFKKGKIKTKTARKAIIY